MTKNFEQEQFYFQQSIKPFQATIGKMLEDAKLIISYARNDPSPAPKFFNLSEIMCNIISYYMVINGMSLNILGVKNEEAVDNARKALYKALVYLENIVPPYVDAKFVEYEEKLATLSSVDEKQRYTFIRKLGLTITLIENAYGTDAKLKWSFVDLEGRFATIVKNLYNLKTHFENTRPDQPGFEIFVYHYQLIVKLLDQTSNRFIERYQVASKAVDDIRAALRFEDALKYVCALSGNPQGTEAATRKSQYLSGLLDKITTQTTQTKSPQPPK
jgi:hypothetical protein